ncbi:hypothetical protein [Roseivivax marinus]|uniref:hypothetical protein n=1 Tax=Roseivivax marinus TaxID=1379903 RepID=UPI00103D42EB|nr:hypothetical protein [Roseivivax marinus]
MQTEVLFYRARGGWRDAAIRCLTGSLYSHCELVAPGQAGPIVKTIGASMRDGWRVRRARIDTGSGSWDVLRFRGDPEEAWSRAVALDGAPYDAVGALFSASLLNRRRPGRWFCSELVGHALGWREPWRFSPGMLAAASEEEGPCSTALQPGLPRMSGC